MANAMYPKGKEGLIDGSIDLDTHTIKALLVDTDYTYSSAHDNLDDIAAGARVGTAQTLASKTVTEGVFDAADSTFTSVTNATDVIAVVLYKDTGVESTSRLICYLDTGVGLPTTPNGGNITVSWDSGTSKIFRLV